MRRMRAIRRRNLLCRSFFNKRRNRRLLFQINKQRKQRELNLPNKKRGEVHLRSRVSNRQYVNLLDLRLSITAFSSVVQRVKSLRTRRVNISSKTFFRGDLFAPPFFLPYYLFRISNFIAIASTHFLHIIRSFFTIFKRHSRKNTSVKLFFFFVYQLFYSSTSYISSHSVLFSFRHPYLSVLNFGGNFCLLSRNRYTYFKLLKQNKFLVSNTFGKRFQQRISNSFVFVWSLVTFLFKFFYVHFIFRFLKFFGQNTRSVFSDSFFFHILHMFVSIRRSNRSYFSGIFSARRMRVSFFRFLLGRYSYRLPFFLFRVSNNVSLFFLLWFFNMYKSLFFSIFFCNIQKDFLMYFLISSISRNRTSSRGVFSFLLKLSALFFYCRSFFFSLEKVRTYSFSIQSYIVFKYRIPSYMFSVCSQFFSFVMHFRIYRLRGGLYRFLKIRALRNLVHQIEHSFFSNQNVQHFFFARFYYKTVPPITNAKMVCESVLVSLSLGVKLNTAFGSVFNWQKYWQHYYDENTVGFFNGYTLNLGNFIYPLKGIRIVCSGPTYKARRTTSLKYHLWVSNDFITGRMPLSFVDLQIDYYQSVVVLRRSNIGLKVWLLFDAVI
jgi:hypothetical protein